LFCFFSGLDDTRNIARIAQQMLRDGSTMPLNDGLAAGVAVAWKIGRTKGGARRASRRERAAAAKTTQLLAPVNAAAMGGALPSVRDIEKAFGVRQKAAQGAKRGA
jgi:hypothetical protein